MLISKIYINFDYRIIGVSTTSVFHIYKDTVMKFFVKSSNLEERQQQFLTVPPQDDEILNASTRRVHRDTSFLSHSVRNCGGLFTTRNRTLFYVCFLLFVVIIHNSAICSAVADGSYTNQWAIQVDSLDQAYEVAAECDMEVASEIFPGYYLLHNLRLQKRSLEPHQDTHTLLSNHPHVKWTEQQVVKKRVKRDVASAADFNDPQWNNQWYFHRGEGLDMNVIPAWAMGYTGKNVVVTILDDGIEKDNPDLAQNYDSLASYDLNGGDPDPQPRYDKTNENKHGTRCAGEVSAAANNNVCSVGVAYESSIGGVRMLDGDVTDVIEARAISHNNQHIDIYSASWGPDDDGRTVDGPATLAQKAFYDGISHGRGGLGSIFVWASGNGGKHHDNCNCDGYTNSIYTVSISSVSERGEVPWYLEKCSSTLVSTYSSGDHTEKKIVTTDLRKKCTNQHSGTSASAPLAAGILALTLQANNQLTWRDIQHLVVMTARSDHLGSGGGWVINGAGGKVSHSFGYGLMDATAMVTLAKNWTTVPEQHLCIIHFDRKLFIQSSKVSVPLITDGCASADHTSVRYIEHVQAKLTIEFTQRGHLQIYLISPFGTRSMLLSPRSKDKSPEGFNDWSFLSTHFWGEDSRGVWTLEIESPGGSDSSGYLKAWTLLIYGTKDAPTNLTFAMSSYSSAKASNKCEIMDANGLCLECHEPYYLLDKRCMSRCPDYYYSSSSSSLDSARVEGRDTVWTCISCYVDCRTCIGPGRLSCITCRAGHLFDSEDGRTCVRFIPEPPVDIKVSRFYAFAVFSVLASVVVFFAVFGLFQSRSHNVLCWKNCNNSSSINYGQLLSAVQFNGHIHKDLDMVPGSDSEEEEEDITIYRGNIHLPL